MNSLIQHNVPRVDAHDVTETGNFTFVIEHSDLGLRPGQWPERIDTDLGNGQPLIRSTYKCDDEGDLQFVNYQQSLGVVVVRIFND